MFEHLGPKEAVYYLTMMIVTGLTYVGLQRAGVEHNIVRPIVAMIAGVGAGWAAERVYLSRKGR